jgi:hypothetical protein
MPGLKQRLMMLLYQALYGVEFVIGKPVIVGQADRLQPELRDVAVAFDVNARRLATIRTRRQNASITQNPRCALLLNATGQRTTRNSMKAGGFRLPLVI